MTFFQPKNICLIVAGISAAALAFVFIGQYGFGLHPCHLCIYQRWPFAVTIFLGLIGAMTASFAVQAILLAGIAFLGNAMIALYHSGVERKYWEGLSGCSTPDMSGSIDDLLARINNTAVTRCDEISWKVLGLSMANYNLLLCLALAAACFIYLVKRPRP